MFTYFAFLFFLLFALLIAAIPSYPLVDLLGLNVSVDSWIENTAKFIALALFFPFVRRLGVNGLKDMGWQHTDQRWRMIGFGLLEGVALIAPIGIVLVLMGVRTLAADFDPLVDISKALVVGLIGGILIGFIEETFFRGAAWNVAKRRNSMPVALLAVALFYATVHFIQVQALSADTPWHWYNGVIALANGLADYPLYFSLSSFSTLVIAGLLLTLVRHQDGHIWRAVGIHAGAVLVIRMIRSTTDVDHHSELLHWVGSYDYVTGWLGSIWLTSIVIGLVLIGRIDLKETLFSATKYR